MGDAKRRREAFIRAHPLCAYCGTRPTATIDHCPPRALFQSRVAPEGLEFPACATCNHGSSNEDLLVSFLARMDPFQNSGNVDGRAVGLMQAVERQYPGILGQMFVSSPSEARRLNRSLGLQPGPGETHQQVGVVRVPEVMHDAVGRFALKFGKAMFYLHAGKPFPHSGAIAFHWFTNAEIVRHGTYPVFVALSNLTGQAPEIERSRQNLRGQFEYKITLAEGNALFVVQAVFGKGFGFVLIGNVDAPKLEAFLERARKESGASRDFFTVLKL